MIDISISDQFSALWPNMKLSCLLCAVKTDENNPILWNKIEELSLQLRQTVMVEEIGQHPVIAASRKAYRALGKDPARYRLSAEALMRRVVKGNDLYRINNVVDIVNLVSATTGFSIGGYDADKINGDITLCIGNAGEPYEAIGRGELNIADLPVLRDQSGAFGSPTSDSVRTCVINGTKRLLMVFFGFGQHNLIDEALTLSEQLLTEHASGGMFEKKSYSNFH